MEESNQEKADKLLAKALFAAAEFQQFDQKKTDDIVEAVYKAGLNERVRLGTFGC